MADVDRLRGTMKIEPADMPDPRRDMHVGRIAGEPHPRQPILHDVERLDHHGRETRPRGAVDDLPLERTFGAEHAAQASETVSRLGKRRDVSTVARIRAVTRNGGAAAETVSVHIDGDDDASA